MTFEVVLLTSYISHSYYAILFEDEATGKNNHMFFIHIEIKYQTDESVLSQKLLFSIWRL